MSDSNPTLTVTKPGYDGFDHLELWVSNAKQAAAWYTLRMGFKTVAYRGLETGHRTSCSHVLQQDKIVLVLTSPLNPERSDMGNRLALKGDAVRDVAFRCTDATALYNKAIERGAKSVMPPTTTKDEHGSVVMATIHTYGDCVHTFVQRNDYNGPFLPGFIKVDKQDPLSALAGAPGLNYVDHVVGNQPDLKMNEACEFYEKILDFHRFWSVDDSQIHTEYSSLRSVVMASPDERIKMPINEPANGKKKSQIQEYVDYHGEAGVQHVALNTSDILNAVTQLRARGLEFLSVPHAYYVDVKKRLAKSPVKVLQDIDQLEKLSILIDFDDTGYLLQLFTKPVQDRPTLFYEVIQRCGHQGFGAGNFKALFESIERDQAERGNL